MSQLHVKNILILPGDGIGPEITSQAIKVLDTIVDCYSLSINYEQGLIGGSAYDDSGNPLPNETLKLAKLSHAVLLGAVGGPKWDTIAREFRPEQGLLQIRKELETFANLRPAITYSALASTSTLKSEVVADLDLMIVRELTGGIYFGTPRGIEEANGIQTAYNTMVYRNEEIERICKVAIHIASKRNGRICSVDKANVLEVSQLWRQIVTSICNRHPEISLSHMYVDNAAMQLVKDPKQFDVILTSNLFGDILSDLAAMLTGSIGMLPSASLNSLNHGIYEPVHGSAPDIAGQNIANPLATILSLAMLLRISLGFTDAADVVEWAVKQSLVDGFRTKDIATAENNILSTQQMGDKVCEYIRKKAG